MGRGSYLALTPDTGPRACLPRSPLDTKECSGL